MLDLGSKIGPQWAGWTLGDDGLLYAPEWRAGLSAGDIRAIPYLHALIADLRRTSRTAQDQRDEMAGALVVAERQARYYRDLVSLEARFGMMLARISG